MHRRYLLVLAAAWLAPALGADPSPSFVEPKLGEGCWVRFFAQKDFHQPIGRLAGYSEPGFLGELATLARGRRVPDLARLGIPERLASLKIVCEKRSG